MMMWTTDHSAQLSRVYADMEIIADNREHLGRMGGLHIGLILIEVLLAGIAVADFIEEVISDKPHGKLVPILLALAVIVLLIHYFTHVVANHLHKNCDEQAETLKREIRRKKNKIARERKRLGWHSVD